VVRPLPEGCGTGVLVNGASYRGPYVAPESLATFFGCGLEGVTEVRATDATGVSAAARILAASSTQVNLVLPRGLASGPAVLTARRGDLELAAAQAHVEAAAPAVFTAGATGEGAPAAVALRVRPDGTRITMPAAACGESGCLPAPIDLGGPEDRTYLLLFGTGIRFAGQARLSVRIAGVEVPVLGFAAQAEYGGLDQVNVELPLRLAGAGPVEVQLAIDEKLANPVNDPREVGSPAAPRCARDPGPDHVRYHRAGALRHGSAHARRRFAWISPLSTVCLSSKDHNNGKGKGKDKGKDKGQGEAGPYFRREDYGAVQRYYSGPRDLPPGLRKKYYRTGKLPPGWEKKIRPFPPDLVRVLPAPPPNCEHGYIDGVAIVYDRKTRIILDSIDLISAIAGH